MRFPPTWVAGLLLALTGPLLAQSTPSQDIPLYLEMLSHPAAGFRSRAVDGLDGAGELAVPALVSDLKSAPIGRALRAAFVLRKMESKAVSAATALRALLSAPIEDWRWSAAVQVLAVISPESRKDILPELIAGLHGGPLRQHAALRALRDIGKDAQEAIPTLTWLLHSRHAPLQGVVIDQSVIDNRSIAWTAALAPYDGLVIVEALIAVGAPADAVVGPLVAMTYGDLPSLRLDAARLLIPYGADAHRAAVPALISLLDDNHYEVREKAIMALGEIGPNAAAATRPLVRMLRRPESLVRREAGIALGKIGPAARSAIPALNKAAAMHRLVDPGSERPFLDAVGQIEGQAPPPPP